MFGKNKNKWYKAAVKVNRKKKLKEPYGALFRYYMFADLNSPDSTGKGHYYFFTFEEWDFSIDAATENLRTVLSEDLFENYLSALEAYKTIDKDSGDYNEEAMTALEKNDEYLSNRDEEMTKILIDYVTEMKEKNIY